MLTFTVTPGLELGPSEKADNGKLNQMARPVIEAQGQASATQIGDKSIDSTKTVPSAHFYAVASGFASNTYAVDFSPDVSLVDGLMFDFQADADCGAAALLNVDSLGAKTLYKFYNQVLEPGDIVAGQMVKVRYSADLGGWQVMSPLASARVIGLANTFSGLRFEYISGTTAQLYSQPGGASAILCDASFNVLRWSSANATTASQAVGGVLNTAVVGLNGRDKATAAEMAGWCYVYIVSDGTQSGLMLSTSPVKPLAAGGFTPLYWCRISAIYNTAGTALRKFSQYERWISVEPHLITTTDLDDTATSYTAISTTANLNDWLAFLPPIARQWRGTMGISQNYGTGGSAAWLALAAHPDGYGEQVLVGSGAATTTAFATHFQGMAASFTLPVRTSTDFWFKTLNPASAVLYAITGSGYEI